MQFRTVFTTVLAVLLSSPTHGFVAYDVVPWGNNRAGTRCSLTRKDQSYADRVWTQKNVSYFAYGSNLDARILQGLRGIQPLKSEAGFVKDYRLAFNLIGIPGVEPSFASAEPSRGETVHGVVYTLSRSDWARLAVSEAINFAYGLEAVAVRTYANSTVPAVTLRTLPGPWRAPFDIPPSRSYLELIRNGAKQNGLSDDYLRKLAAIRPNRLVLFPARY